MGREKVFKFTQPGSVGRDFIFLCLAFNGESRKVARLIQWKRVQVFNLNSAKLIITRFASAAVVALITDYITLMNLIN